MTTSMARKTKEADRIYHAGYRDRDRGKYRANANRYQKNELGRKRVLLNNVFTSARTRGLECTITREELKELLAPMVCSMTGIPLEFAARSPWSPSFDRLDSSKGYVPGNVRLVCWAYNSAKMGWDDEDVLTLAKALVARLDPIDHTG